MKKVFYLLSLFILLISCNSDSFMSQSSVDSPIKAYSLKYNLGNDLQANFHGRIIDTSGNAISGASVTVGTSIVITSSDGFFELKNVFVKQNFALIKIVKDGFVETTKVIIPNNGENRVDVMLIPNNLLSSKTISSGTPNTIVLTSNFKVSFDGNFEDINGKNYTGQVIVNLYNLKSSNEYFKEMMQGSYLGGDKLGNPKFFESFSMVYVELKDINGQPLQISKGHTAEITIPIDQYQVSTAPSTLSLMSYDAEKGYWKEEGEAIKNGNSYVGKVSHFSWWGTCLLSDYCKLNFIVKDEQDNPKSFLPINLVNANKTHYPNSVITNEKGEASIIAPANLPINIKIYDNCKQVMFSKDLEAYVKNSVNSVPLTLPTSNASFEPYVITGTVKDCSENLVSKGFVYLKPSTPNFFQYNYAVINNGTFSLNTYLCSTNPSFVLKAVDDSNFKISDDIKFTAKTKNVNVGTLVTCDQANEYITYQVDNGTVRNCIGDFGADYANIVFKDNDIYFALESLYGLNSSNLGIFIINNEGKRIHLSDQYYLIFKLDYFGEIGTYLDFTFEGVAKDSNGKTYNVKGKGHVKRDS